MSFRAAKHLLRKEVKLRISDLSEEEKLRQSNVVTNKVRTRLFAEDCVEFFTVKMGKESLAPVPPPRIFFRFFYHKMATSVHPGRYFLVHLPVLEAKTGAVEHILLLLLRNIVSQSVNQVDKPQ